jgi:hypothetical protein
MKEEEYVSYRHNKTLTLNDFSIKKEEEYQNFILPLIVTAPIASKSKKKGAKRDAGEIKAAQEAQRAAYEKNKGTIADIDIENKTCNELEEILASVINQQSDSYNLNESQKNTLNAQKKAIEAKIKSQNCQEIRQKETAAKMQQAESELSRIEAEKKTKQKKVLTYVGLGVGGLVVAVLFIKLIK